MSLYLYALGAGICAVTLEVVFRKSDLHYFQLLFLTIPLQIILGYAVWKVFTQSEHLLSGAIIFTLGTATSRLIASFFILKEFPPTQTLIAFGLIILAQLVRFIPFK